MGHSPSRQPVNRDTSVQPSAAPITNPFPASPKSDAPHYRRRLGFSEDKKEEYERHRKPVVEAGFQVQGVANLSGTRVDETMADVTTGSVGESTAPSRKASAHDKLAEEKLRPQRKSEKRNRHRKHDRSCWRAPVHAQELAVDDQAVGKEREDQRQLDDLDDALVAGRDHHDVE